MISNPPAESAQANAQIAYELIDESDPQLLVVEFLNHAITDPSHAAELGRQLSSLIRPELPKRFVLDFQNVRAMSSTAFGALVSFILKARLAGGQSTICNMNEFVRFGADVIRIGDYAEFAADRNSAIQGALNHH